MAEKENIPPNLGKAKRPTEKETRKANAELYDRPKRVCISKKAERMAKLSDEEKMRVFGLCNGSNLLGVNTSCVLGDEGMRAKLTWFNTRIKLDQYGEYRSGTGRCDACETVNAKNILTTRPERYLQVCAKSATMRYKEPVELVREAFHKVFQAEGYRDICQVCRQDVVWLQGRMDTASMNRIADVPSYIKEEQHLETNCLCCNRTYEGYFGGDPKEIHERIGSYIRPKKFDPTGDVISQLKKLAEDEDRLIIDLDLDTHINYCLSRSKNNAKTKKNPHNLTFDYMKKLVVTQYFGCALSGVLGAMERKKWNSFSIDKIVPGDDIGYVEGNVQWVILPMNRGKNVHKDEDFRKHLKKIYT